MFSKKIVNYSSGAIFENHCNGAFYLILLIYCFYQLIIFLSWTAMSPDEISFIAGSKVYLFADRSAPPLNYGTFFWAVLAIFKTPLLLRIVFLGFFIAIPYLLLSTIQRAPIRLLAFLFYLSLPYAFWTGKLISPEILILFFIALSLFIFSKGKTGYAFLVGGLSIGIKITAAPYVLFLFILALCKHHPRMVANYFLLTFLGTWLANPINLDLYFINLLGTSGNADNLLPINLERIQQILFLPSWSWDMILTNSFTQLICNPYCIVALFIAIAIKDRLTSLALLSSSIFSLVLVYLSKDTYAWYFFPLIPILIFSIGSLGQNYPKLSLPINFNLPAVNPTYLIKIVVPIVIVLLVTLFNFYSNIQYSIFQAAEKFSQINSRRQYPSSCIAKAIKDYQPQLIVNKTDREIDRQIIPENALVRGAFGSSLDTNKRSMAIISMRFLKNTYHIDTLIYENQAIKKYRTCDGVIIFISR
jgi:hypothetical protein